MGKKDKALLGETADNIEVIEKKAVKKRKRKKVLSVVALCLAVMIAVPSAYYAVNSALYARMTFIGHATVKIITRKGTVIYIDPYFPVGNYLEPADYVLLTHGHSDHNNIGKLKLAENCKIITWREGVVDGKYNVFEEDDVRIEAVPSGGNYLHDPAYNVGYIVTVDGVSVYHAGDTVMFDGLKQIVGKEIDYAMYPVDGTYTMTPEEAGEVADMIGATYNIPIHGGNEKTFPEQRKRFSAKGKLPMFWGQTIFLKKHRLFNND